MTLSKRLSEDELQFVLALAQTHFEPVLDQALRVDALTIVTEQELGAPLLEPARFSLVSSSQRAA
jgi:Protein of unknown function (DUF1045)